MVVDPDQAAPRETTAEDDSGDDSDDTDGMSGWRRRLWSWLHRWGPVK